jgi:hypothetical protein
MESLPPAPLLNLVVRPQEGAGQMSIIQRFRLDVLQEQEGRLYLNGQPFTGIAYEVQGDRVTANYQVTNGFRDGPAEAWDPTRIRALFEEVITVDAEDTNEEFPKEGEYFSGVLFYGVAYEFDAETGRLAQERDFGPTAPAPSREWFPSGALEGDYDRARPDGDSESETYYEDGRTSTVEAPGIGWGLTPQGHLRTLRLRPAYSNTDLQRLPFRVDSRLWLASQGVTDEIVERLEDLRCLEYLCLDGTRISASGLARFRVCTNLKEFVTENNTGFGDADVQNLLADLPGCEWRRR